jgi:DNA-binding beta-propeller fold protein YncE
MQLSKKTTCIISTAVLTIGMSLGVQAQTTGTAYVSNQNGSVTIIDLATMTPTKTLDVGAKGPRGIGITADGKYLVTANKDGANASIIELATGKTRLVNIGKNPEFVRVMGDKAFITYEPSSKGGPPPKPGQPVAKEEDDDDDDVPARIVILDIKKAKVLKEITSGPETEGIEFSADGKKMIVTNEADNTITVHDIKSGKLLKTIPTSKFGDRPRGIKISPDGKTFVSTLEYGNKVLVLNDEFEPVTTFETAKTPYGIAFDHTGKRLFVAAAHANVLQVFDATTYAKIKDIPSGQRCWHFTFTPTTRRFC